MRICRRYACFLGESGMKKHIFSLLLALFSLAFSLFALLCGCADMKNNRFADGYRWHFIGDPASSYTWQQVHDVESICGIFKDGCAIRQPGFPCRIYSRYSEVDAALNGLRRHELKHC